MKQLIFSEKVTTGSGETNTWKYRSDVFDRISALICLALYLVFPLVDGPILCVDSTSYISMDFSREPVYPAFLAILRRVFGDSDYLMAAVLLQSVLAAYAAWKLMTLIRRECGGSKVMAVLAFGCQYGVTLLNRFAAGRGSAYTECIMTEGLGLSLYTLFILQLYLYIRTERRRNLAGLLIYAHILINLRKQMMITLLLAAFIFLWREIREGLEARKTDRPHGSEDKAKENANAVRSLRQRAGRIVILFLLLAAVLCTDKAADRVYNYAVRGAFEEHSGNSMGFLCTLLYSSDPEHDAELFEDAELRSLYEQIMEQADEQELLYAYGEDGLLKRSNHFSECYDAIGYGITNPVIQGYLRQTADHELTTVELYQGYDDYCVRISRILLRQKPEHMVRTFFCNFLKGLINTVARAEGALCWYSAAVYALIFGLYFYLRRKKRGDKNAALRMTEIVLSGVVIDSLVVAALIFTQSRYMIYSMSLLYVVLIMELRDMYQILRPSAK